MKNKRLVLMVISIFMLFMIIFGASYSYFAAQGIGSGDDRQVTTTVGELKLTYSDGSEYLTTNGDWEPGDYITKSFTVTNNSSTIAYYRLYMDDVVNTFVMRKKDEQGNTIEDAPYELIYILKKNDEVVISEESNMPVLTDAGIIYGSEGFGIEIAANTTNTYELTIKFIDTGLNQNYNQSKVFSAKIDLKLRTLYEKFTTMMETRTDMALDDYDNIRFVGKTSNNYISFNGEDWRIVGIFKDVEVINDDGTITKDDLIKIVRSESLGKIPWDSNGAYGENNWINADLMNILNNDYLNNEGIYTQTSLIKSLTNVSDYIAMVRWNIGGHNSTAMMPRDIYLKERGRVGSGNNPSVTTWDGKIALMYPSDYGYSVKGNDNTENATNCLNTNMNIWNNNGCANTSWFHNGSSRWLLTSWSAGSYSVFYIDGSGYLHTNNPYNINIHTFPTLYLKPNIKLTGTGERGENIFRIVE